jgi:hypothetical protein
LGARASTAEGSPFGQVGGGSSSPELLADGKGGKTGTAAVFFDKVGAPVAGGVLHRGGEEEEAQAQVNPEKRWQGGARGSAHRGGVHDGGGGRTTAVAHSDRGTALGQRCGRLRTWETARWRLRTLAGRNGIGLYPRPRHRQRCPARPIGAQCYATLTMTRGPRASVIF